LRRNRLPGGLVGILERDARQSGASIVQTGQTCPHLLSAFVIEVLPVLKECLSKGGVNLGIGGRALMATRLAEVGFLPLSQSSRSFVQIASMIAANWLRLVVSPTCPATILPPESGGDER